MQKLVNIKIGEYFIRLLLVVSLLNCNDTKRSIVEGNFICHDKIDEKYVVDVSISSSLENHYYDITGDDVEIQYMLKSDITEGLVISNGDTTLIEFCKSIIWQENQILVYKQDQHIPDGLGYSFIMMDFGPILMIAPAWPDSYCSVTPKGKDSLRFVQLIDSLRKINVEFTPPAPPPPSIITK